MYAMGKRVKSGDILIQLKSYWAEAEVASSFAAV